MRREVGADTRPGIVVAIATAGDMLQWNRLIAKVFQADPLVCQRCGGPLKVVAYITDTVAIRRILDHLGLSPPEKPPPDVREVVRVPVDDEGRQIEAPTQPDTRSLIARVAALTASAGGVSSIGVNTGHPWAGL